MNQSKVILRNQIKLKLSELNSEEKIKSSQNASDHLLEFLHSRRLKNISITHSIADEIDTRSFIKKYLNEFKFFLPKVNTENNSLSLHPVSNLTNDLKAGSLGILEPITVEEKNWQNLIECLIVPASALDIEGHRLGRGKGYYDRLISSIDRQKITIICLIYHCQLVAEVPIEEFDEPIDYCITEKGVFHLRRKSE